MHEQIEFQFIEAKAGKSCHKCGEDIVGKAISQIYCSKECREEVWCKDSRCRANRRPVKGGKRKACPHCGEDVVGRASKVYCSNKCYNAAQSKAALEKRIKDLGDRFCPVCEKDVVGPAGKVYCSKKCRKAAKNKARCEKRAEARVVKSCRQCGEDFVGKGDKVYCSVECRDTYWQQAKREERIKARVNKACRRCGKDVIGPANKVYCSGECRDAAKREKQIKARVAKECRHCGNDFVGAATRVYCSKKCRKKARRRAERGTDAYKAQKARWRKGWKKRHPAKAKERSKANKHRRRARLKNNGIEDTSDYRARMTHPLVRQVCFYCGTDCTGAFHWDHRIPIAAGGPDAEWNLVIACPPCNLKKGSKVPKTLFAEEIFNEP